MIFAQIELNKLTTILEISQAFDFIETKTADLYVRHLLQYGDIFYFGAPEIDILDLREQLALTALQN